MDLKEFKKYEKENNYNLVDKWNYNAFALICRTCNSNNVKVLTNAEVEDMGSGCETCGYGGGSKASGYLTFKCIDCGSAMSLNLKEDILK